MLPDHYIITVDLDSTLADTTHRAHMLLEDGINDWDAYSQNKPESKRPNRWCRLRWSGHSSPYFELAGRGGLRSEREEGLG